LLPVIVLSAAVALFGEATSARGSGLLQTAVGPADMAMGGTTIAEPLSPSGALFANPAGLARFSRTTLSNSVGIGFGKEQVTSPSGYDESNEIVAMVPDIALSVARPNGWHYGIGFSGSVGMNYDFPADPAAGVDHLMFAECSIAGLPLAVAKRVSDSLWLGAELVPLLGYQRDRYHMGDSAFTYKLIGPGIQGMVGATWKPDEHWSLGLGLRTPGRVWMDGSESAPGGGRQDVDLEVEMPTQLAIGVERQLGNRLRLAVSGRWTDSSTFRRSTAGFSAIPDFRPAFIPDARDEWRGALGARYALSERLELRGAIGYSTRIVGTEGVSPMVFDNDHVALTGGAGWRLSESWTLDFMAGLVPSAHRNVSEEDAMVLAGRYETSGFVFILGIQRRY
jgi:long-subunit fatty acid transport protein